jgi:putative membrane protein
MKMILRFLVMALTVFALPTIVPGIEVHGIYPAIVAAVLLGLLNFFVKPIIGLITLPLNIFTLGLFGLVINALLLWFVASFVSGFAVASFVAAFWGGLIVSFMHWVSHRLIE